MKWQGWMIEQARRWKVRWQQGNAITEKRVNKLPVKNEA